MPRLCLATPPHWGDVWSLTKKCYLCGLKHLNVKKQPIPDIATTLSCVIAAIQEKKGERIVDLNLDALPNAVCSRFVVCSAASTTQVDAIAQNVEHRLLEAFHEKPHRTAGYENALWVVLDYVDVVVHVFQTEQRDFYKLEELWADAPTTHHDDSPSPQQPAVSVPTQN